MQNLFKSLICLLFTTVALSQESNFKFDKDGFTDYVVIECPGKTQEDLYKKALDWVAVTYKDPEEVIKAKIVNDYIRIEGSSENLILLNVLGKSYYRARYQIEISLKDGKYKFDIIDIRQYTPSSKYTSGGWAPLNIAYTTDYYNKKGELRGMYKYLPDSLTNYFNDLNNSLKKFVDTETSSTKKNEW